MTQLREFTATIDGKAVAARAFMPVTNPATEVVIAATPDCDREQLDEVV